MPTVGLTFSAARQAISAALGDLITFTAASGSTTQCTATGAIASRPAGSLIGAELSSISGTGSGQTTNVTNHTVASGTVTLTFPTMTALGNDTVIELHDLNNRGFTKKQYDDALYAAADIWIDRYFTDTENVSLALEKGGGGVTVGGIARREYPIPASTFNYLWEVALAQEPPLVRHPIGYLNTTRAFGDDAARTRVGQGFQLSQQALIGFIAVYMGKVGAPTDNLTCVVETDSSAIPSGTAVGNGTSATVGGSTVQTRLRYVVFSFSPPMLLLENTTYHWTMRRSGAADASNYYSVAEDDGNHYSLGAASTRNATVWSAVSGSDFLFAVSPADARWAPLARANWRYVNRTSDQLEIAHGIVASSLFPEGTIVRLAGGAAIARPAAETTNLPIDPVWCEQFALQYLRSLKAGIASADNHAAGAQVLRGNMGLLPLPVRPLRANSVRVWT